MRSILTLLKGRIRNVHLPSTIDCTIANELETCRHMNCNLSSLYFHMYVTNVCKYFAQFEETCEVIDIFVHISWRLLKRLFCSSKDFIS